MTEPFVKCMFWIDEPRCGVVTRNSSECVYLTSDPIKANAVCNALNDIALDRPALVEWFDVKTHGMPPDGQWCWVVVASSDLFPEPDPFPAVVDSDASGGWSNEDCWEDYSKAVTHWQPIAKPEPPK
jgi:hypothetical protein